MSILLLLLVMAEKRQFNVEGFYNLPEWAAHHAVSMDLSKAPAHASVWCLLNETLLGFDKQGRLLVRHRVVYAVLDQAGAAGAAVYAQGFSRDVGSLQRIRGWHLPRTGILQASDQDDFVTYGTSSVGLINTQAVSATGFDFVGKGSVLAYESVKTEKNYLGAVGFYPLLAPYPTREFRIKLVEEQGKGEHVRLLARGLKAWGLRAEHLPNELVVYGLPALESTAFTPANPDFFPFITAQFLATEEDRNRYQDWDHYARWYWGLFHEAALDEGVSEAGRVNLEALLRMQKPLRERVAYQQVYLSNARGYVPAKGSDVIRRAYGDCKDMVACFAHKGEAEKVQVLPVLANIVDGAFLTEKMHPYPLFNHLIAAVPLSESLGLPAEVVAEGRRYLIYDPTSADTAFGYLPRGYLGRSVLICSADGATWVEIPEGALEPGDIRFELEGRLDGAMGFEGTLSLYETGNAYLYRTLIKRHGKRVTTQYLRANLPPAAHLLLTRAAVHEDGSAEVVWRLTCPDFLKREGPGFRLPDWILPPQDQSMRKGWHPREMPIFIEEAPKTTWTLKLATEVPMEATQVEATGKGAFWQYRWRAGDGAGLALVLELGYSRAVFRRGRVVQGIAAWQDFQKAYQRFRREQTLLRLRPGG